MSARQPMPRWADIVLMPGVSVLAALVISGLVVLSVGESPIAVVQALFVGAFGSGSNLGFTLYYATNFVFTGLAFAIAAHAGLFNIGANGQAFIASAGVILVALALDQTHWLIAMPAGIIAAALFGGAWALIPGYLQAKRGSHIVITTIMFNFIAASVMGYLLTGPLKSPTSQAPMSSTIDPAGRIPQLGEFIPAFGRSPVNLSIVVAVLLLIGMYVLIWRTRLGYAIRTLGHNPTASRYAGMSNSRLIVGAMMIAGACAGMVALNEIMGRQHRVTLDFIGQVGFIGIAVALIGRNHPVGIGLAAILFGVLYQGGQEIQFVIPRITTEMIEVIQALIILFTGAMEGLFRPALERSFAVLSVEQRAEAARRATPETES